MTQAGLFVCRLQVFLVMPTASMAANDEVLRASALAGDVSSLADDIATASLSTGDRPEGPNPHTSTPDPRPDHNDAGDDQQALDDSIGELVAQWARCIDELRLLHSAATNPV